MQIHAPTQAELDALPRAIILAGPTAVGKTALSFALAESLDAELVNMDSVQIYKGLDIGSAKASLEERARIPHHLIDVLEPPEEHNVGEYKNRALEVIEELHQRDKVAILVGGTGLYLRVLVHGLLDAPPPDESIRARHREIANTEEGLESLHAELTRVDPVLAGRIHHRDYIRISRGLEIFEQTGRPLSTLQKEHQFRLPNLNVLKIALWRPRQELYARINARVDAMIERGFVQECEALFERYPRECKVFSSLGYRQMAEHLLDEAPLLETIEAIKQKTRRYAKQQLTWLRSEPDVRWVCAPVLSEEGRVPGAMLEDVRAFLAEGRAPEGDWFSERDI